MPKEKVIRREKGLGWSWKLVEQKDGTTVGYYKLKNYLPSDKAFERHALAIGQAAIAWNSLHESISRLFVALIGRNKAGQISQSRMAEAAWYSVRSDRSQRDMMRAVAKSAHTDRELTAAVYERVDWLLREANKIAETRDDAIHAPLVIDDRYSRIPTVMPTGTAHPRANNLRKKELLSTFRWCRDASVVLESFAREMYYVLQGDRAVGNGHGQTFFVRASSFDDIPLPAKPELPSPGQKRRRQGPRRQPPPK